jgi:hypothetical protein
VCSHPAVPYIPSYISSSVSLKQEDETDVANEHSAVREGFKRRGADIIECTSGAVEEFCQANGFSMILLGQEHARHSASKFFPNEESPRAVTLTVAEPDNEAVMILWKGGNYAIMSLPPGGAQIGPSTWQGTFGRMQDSPAFKSP